MPSYNVLAKGESYAYRAENIRLIACLRVCNFIGFLLPNHQKTVAMPKLWTIVRSRTPRKPRLNPGHLISHGAPDNPPRFEAGESVDLNMISSFAHSSNYPRRHPKWYGRICIVRDYKERAVRRVPAQLVPLKELPYEFVTVPILLEHFTRR